MGIFSFVCLFVGASEKNSTVVVGGSAVMIVMFEREKEKERENWKMD